MELRVITAELKRRFGKFAKPIEVPRALSPVPEIVIRDVDQEVQDVVVVEEIPIIEIMPMDLSEIAVKINGSVYLSPQQWIDDIDLIVKVQFTFIYF